MSLFLEKLWSAYPGWYDRDAPLRHAVLASAGGMFEGLRGSMRQLALQRHYSTADWSEPIGGCITSQLKGQWRVAFVDRLVTPRVYTLGRTSSGELGLAYRLSSGVVQCPRVPYRGPGLYRLYEQPGGGHKVWIVVGNVSPGTTESFEITRARSPDYLRLVLERKGFHTTQGTNPVEDQSMALNVQFRARHYFTGFRMNRPVLEQALKMVDPTAEVRSYREDWTGRIWSGFGFIGFIDPPNQSPPPLRSYWSTVWKSRPQQVNRIVVRCAPKWVRHPEIALTIDRYRGAGIQADIWAHESQVGLPPT